MFGRKSKKGIHKTWADVIGALSPDMLFKIIITVLTMLGGGIGVRSYQASQTVEHRQSTMRHRFMSRLDRDSTLIDSLFREIQKVKRVQRKLLKNQRIGASPDTTATELAPNRGPIRRFLSWLNPFD